MGILLHDLRCAFRQLRRVPGFTALALFMIALGIGANVALFTVVRSVLLKPLPFEDPNRLLMLYEHSSFNGKDFPFNLVAGGVFDQWNKLNTTFSSMAIVQENQADLSASGGQLPELLNTANVSWNLFSTLGVRPALGRDFVRGDDTQAANGVAVLSWSLWKRRFGGDPAILNRTIYVDANPRTVIGVMPAWFSFPYSNTELWMPVYHEVPPEMISHPDFHMFRVVGRLKPGVSAAEATSNLSLISERLHNSQLSNPFISAAANSRPLLEHLVGDLKRPLYVLFAATACLLLIACLNVSNLLVARAVSRRKELAIRTALGGGRLRLLREHLMESLLLSAIGGAAGLALAFGLVEWLVRTREDMMRVESIHIDAVVVSFTVGMITLCALFSGLVSALNAGDKRLFASLHESSRSHSAGGARARLRKVLLTAEVSLTVVLLIGAGLLLKSYQHLRFTDMGCATDNVLTMRINLPAARYKTPGPAPVSLFDSLLNRVRALPGVDAAGFVTDVPGQGYGGDFSFTVAEHPPLPEGKGTTAINRSADPGYFAAMGIPILRGRTFGDDQRLDHANEVIISDSFAKEYFPHENPLGKHLRVMGGKDLHEIVAVVGDTRYSIGEAPRPTQYYPLYAGDTSGGTLVIRSNRDVMQFALPVQRIIQAMDPDLPVSDVLTMNQLLNKSTLDSSFDSILLSGLAILSLLLAAAGLFGVLTYIVAQRSGEIGIRIALGAQRDQVLGLMLTDGLRPALLGLVVGLAASAALVRLMKAMLYETQPLDPTVFAAVTGVLLLVATVACLAPAWRASRLDPMQALRSE
jgi:putative ABC transport system permease protein